MRRRTIPLAAAAQALVQRLARQAKKASGHALVAAGAPQGFRDEVVLGFPESQQTIGNGARRGVGSGLFRLLGGGGQRARPRRRRC
jgi:hypothetical protein